MNIGSNFNHNMPNFINQNKANTESILDKIAATRELSGKDSSSLIIADQLSSQISTATQELQNTNEKIGMLQIADGALQGISDNTMRLEELSVRYNSASLNTEQKNMLTKEFDALRQSSADIAQQTTYNGQNLFGGNSPLGLSSVSTDELAITDQSGIQAFRDQLSSLRSDVGSATQGAEVSVNNLLASITTVTASYSQISEQPLDQKIADLSVNNVKLTASILAQSHQTQTLQQQMGSLLNF